MVHVWVSQRAGFMLPDFSWFQCRSVFVLVTLRIIRAKNRYLLNITVSPKLSSTCEIFIPYWECSYPSCYSGFSYSQQKKKAGASGEWLVWSIRHALLPKSAHFLVLTAREPVTLHQGHIWSCLVFISSHCASRKEAQKIILFFMMLQKLLTQESRGEGSW